MNIDVAKNGTSLLMTVSGRIDPTTAPEFEKAVMGESRRRKGLCIGFKRRAVHLVGRPAHPAARAEENDEAGVHDPEKRAEQRA